MEDNSNLGRLVAFARMGFAIVPQIMTHDKYGPVTLYMDGDGIRACSLETGEEVMKITWEEFDQGPVDKVRIG